MNIELVQNKYKPIITHDMHQQGPTGSRIFVPPFTDPFDPNIHPLLALGQATVGQAMASALIAERQGRRGVARGLRHVVAGAAVHGLSRPAAHPHRDRHSGGNLADPFVNPQRGRPLGPQEPRWNFPVPYSKDTWTLGQQVDYGVTAALAGMSHVAKYGHEWLYNFYRVHRDWVNYDKGAVRVRRAGRRSAISSPPTRCSRSCEFGDVEIHRATRAVHRQRQAVSRRVVRDQDRAALRRVRQDDAREAGVSGPAASSRAGRRSRPTTSPATRCGC